MDEKQIQQIREQFAGVISTNQVIVNDAIRSTKKALVGLMRTLPNNEIKIHGALTGSLMFKCKDVDIKTAYVDDNGEIRCKYVTEDDKMGEERAEYISGFDLFDIYEVWEDQVN